MPNLKIRPEVHHLNNTSREEIIKLLLFLLLQATKNLATKSYFSKRQILKMTVFSELFSNRQFHSLLMFFVLLIINVRKKPHVIPQGCTQTKTYIRPAQ
jgi:hypothetical protein